MKSSGLSVSVFITIFTANSLVTARAEGPTAIFFRWSVSGQKHHTNIGLHACVIKGSVELINGLRPKGVSHLGPGKTNSHNAKFDMTVVADVGQGFKTTDALPRSGIKELGNLIGHAPRLIP